MKIYNEIVFDVDGNVIYEDSYEYSGDVMLAKDDDDFDVEAFMKFMSGDTPLFENLSFQDLPSEEMQSPVIIDTSAVNIPPGQTPSTANQKLQQAQAVDIQANPLPSLPSVANVGSVAYTGTVSKVPGGFQPLPQVTGNKKKLYQLSKFHGGVNQKSSPRDIADSECRQAENITFSNVGKITVLGDLKSTTANVVTSTLASSATHIPCSGYGLFVFKSAYTLATTPVQEECDIVASVDGRHLELIDQNTSASATDKADLVTISNVDTDNAPVFYAAGNAVYVNDANFAHTTARRIVKMTYREDAGSNTVQGWQADSVLLNSPAYDSDTDAAMAAGTVKCTHNQALVDGNRASVDGTVIAQCEPVGTAGEGDGSWGSTGATTYYFYISWLFDDGCETGLTSFADDGGPDEDTNGIACNKQGLEFNISIKHEATADGGGQIGNGDKRIEGGRIYFKEAGTADRWLLAEFNLIDGVRGALDSTFLPWVESSDVYYLASDILFTDPPEVYSYSSLNAYYATEVYTESKDVITSGTSGPAAHDLRYKTAVIGSVGIVFIGNVRFKGKVMPDVMMYSMPGKPGIFPKFNTFDSPSSDGTQITALAAFRDTILQFKENGMYVINVSNPQQFYAQASFRDCGVFNPCQVFTTAFGVIFANKNGCFIYDGQKVMSLTAGKFNITDWDIAESSSIAGDDANVPCVGYDPRSRSIVVLQDIGDNSLKTTAWVYSMDTQSWSLGSSMITNTVNDRHSNFIISPNGYLSICQDAEETLKTYVIGTASSNQQVLLYQTKDFDFGFPSQTKKLFKVYVTYKGNPTNLILTWRANGIDSSVTDYAFTATNWDDAGTTDYEIATFVPDDEDEGKDWKSMSLLFNSGSNAVATDLEIQDISILYRLRPIK